MEERCSHNKVYMGIAIILFALSLFPFWGDRFCDVAGKLFLPMIFASYGVYFSKKEKYILDDSELKRNFRVLIIPYLWFSLFFILKDAIGVFTGAINNDSRNVILFGDILKCLILDGGKILWYLPCLFFAVLFYSLIRSRVKFITAFIIFAVFAGIVIYINVAYEFAAGIIGLKRVLAGFVLFTWKTVIMTLFIAVGEVAERIVMLIKNNKIAAMFLGLLLIVSGCMLTVMSGSTNPVMLIFDKWYLYFPGMILLMTGIYFIAYWINQAAVFEALGNSADIIYITAVEFGIADLSLKYIDEMLVNAVHNYFFAHTVAIVAFVIVQMAITCVINKYLYFLIGKRH